MINFSETTCTKRGIFLFMLVWFCSNTQLVKAEEGCIDYFSVGRFSGHDDSELGNTICQFKGSKIKLYGSYMDLGIAGLSRPTIGLQTELYKNDGILLVERKNIENLFSIFIYYNNKIYKTGGRGEKLYLYEDMEQHVIIRCEKHPEYYCVSYLRIEQRYKTFIDEMILSLRIGHRLTDLNRFPEYYKFAKKISNTYDFQEFIVCDADLFMCDGKRRNN